MIELTIHSYNSSGQLNIKLQKMRIDKIIVDKKKYLDLLLLADEQESMIDRYLDRGEMFVMYDSENEPICSAVITDEGNDICELKNLAVSLQHQRKGYGKRMVNFLCTHYANRFKSIIVGTGDSIQTVSFYKSCGFYYSHTIPDFFTINYAHPIVEDGKVLKDMIYFRRELVYPCSVCKNKRTTELISSLQDVWEKSIRATHKFLTEKNIEELKPAVYDALMMVEHLVVLYHNEEPIGFIGMEALKIEMLFLSPEYFGYGYGRLLMNTALDEYKCIFVDVNEQNPNAWNFYRHMDFYEIGRSKIDDQGNPFPIIRMKLHEK